jgi:hypothetical protein
MWSKEEVDRLNQSQKSRLVHPYTCDRGHPDCEVNQRPRDYSKDGILIATEQGWICPCGNYKQNWYHK